MYRDLLKQNNRAEVEAEITFRTLITLQKGGNET